MKNKLVNKLMIAIIFMTVYQINGQCYLEATISPSDSEICIGEDVTITVNVTSGIEPYSYNWNDGQYTSSSITVSPTETSEYQVVVTDALGFSCQLWLESTIVVNGSPLFVMNTQSTTCGLSNGSISSDVLGGISIMNYEWSNGATTSSISGLAAGDYELTVTSVDGCTAQQSTTVGISEEFITLLSTTNTICGLDNGSIISDYTGGFPMQYEWSNGSTSSNLTSLAPGVYSLSVTSISGCLAVQSTTVQPSITIQASSFPNHTSCGLNNGQISVEISGGVAQSFDWSNGQSGSIIYNLSPGEYTVTATSTEGCESIQSTFIQPSETVQASTYPSHTFCGLNNGQIGVELPGSQSFAWSNGQTGNIISDLTPGEYIVTATSVDGCLSVVSTIIESSLPYIAEAIAFPTTCGANNGKINTTITGGVILTLQWSNGSTESWLENLEPGEYILTTSSVEGCMTSVSATIESSTPLIAVATSTPVTCVGCSDGTATVVGMGASNYTYIWSNGSTTDKITGLQSGTYVVSITGQNGCNAETAVFVTDALVATENIDNQNVKIYPNPTADRLYISSNYDLIKVKLYDIQGKNVLKFVSKIDGGFNICELPYGVYVLWITTTLGSSKHKIVKI